MIIQFETGDNWARLHVIRQNDDPKFYSESRLWYAIKNELNARGYDLIKKSPGNDGHLTGADYYLRIRSHRSQSPHVYIYDSQYAIRMMYTPYNEGQLTLDIALNVYGKQPDCIERIKQLENEYE
jgi:hypothetical protein